MLSVKAMSDKLLTDTLARHCLALSDPGFEWCGRLDSCLVFRIVLEDRQTLTEMCIIVD